ncbi:MAG: hypothetical protein ACI9ZD_001735, partial [Paracoccaceae bacterium]
MVRIFQNITPFVAATALFLSIMASPASAQTDTQEL